MRKLAVLSMHTSPLAQPGTGDGGGMNVYVRELSAAVARTGIVCDVYTRAHDDALPDVVAVEPGLRVHHVDAGPRGPVPKEDLPGLVDAFAEGVMARIDGTGTDLLHANYWLSGVAGHAVKHALDLPLVSTFHTLARVKAEADEAEPWRRVQAESEVIGCSDAVLASCTEEARDIERLYDADADRIAIVAPGVEHAFFAPGDRGQARRALGLPPDHAVLLFVGRIQPLKGLDIAVRSLAALGRTDARLVVVGGPSGPDGEAEVARIHDLVESLGLGSQVHFVPPQPHELLSTYYRAADVCIVPSRSESFGLVALEAAACGTPVVASAVGGLRTLVDDGRSGYLVEPRDPIGFAAAVSDILADPWRAAEMSANAAARARRYTWREAAQGLRRLYDTLTERSLVECR